MSFIALQRSSSFSLFGLLLSSLMLLAIATSAPAHGTLATRASSPLAATFEAHGGLAAFQAQRQMSYRMVGFPLSGPMSKPNTSTVDLQTRRNRIDGDGFTVAFDGKRAWSTPGPDAVGLPPRFVTLGSFYFIGMPFVFGDPGVVLTDDGMGQFCGKSYRVVQVSYDRGTGYTEDDYTLFIDPDTDRLALFNHAVNENPDVDRVTWTIDEYQEVDGLLVPARMTFYPGWNPEQPGDGASFTIEDVRLDSVRPDASLYHAPANAVIDDRADGH